MMRTINLLVLATFFILPFGLFAQDEEPLKEKSEETIKYEELPPKVQKAHKSGDYKDWDIAEVEKVETNKGQMYELEVKKGKKKYELYYDKEGKLAEKNKEKEAKEHPEKKEHPEGEEHPSGGGHEHPTGQEHPK